MPATPDQSATRTPLARTPSDRSKTTMASNNETPRKSEEDHQDVSNGAILDVEKGVETMPAGEPVPDRFLVDFDGPNDPGNPKNWTPKRRWCITISMGLMVFTVTFASSIFSVNIGVIVEKFDVSLVTATLGVALFVLVGVRPISTVCMLTGNCRASCLDPLRSDLCQKFLDANSRCSSVLRYSPSSRSQWHLPKT